MLQVRCYPDPVLRKVAEPIEVIDDKLRALAEEMIESMYEENGVGLAAPQIGESIRLVVIDTTPEERNPIVLINPEIVEKSRKKVAAEEGCLSLPGLSASISRPEQVTVEAQDLDGNEIVIEGDGLLARALQHEIDHLDGVLFIDKASIAAKFSLRGDLHALEAEYAAADTTSD